MSERTKVELSMGEWILACALGGVLFVAAVNIGRVASALERAYPATPEAK